MKVSESLKNKILEEIEEKTKDMPSAPEGFSVKSIREDRDLIH